MRRRFGMNLILSSHNSPLVLHNSRLGSCLNKHDTGLTQRSDVANEPGEAAAVPRELAWKASHWECHTAKYLLRFAHVVPRMTGMNDLEVLLVSGRDGKVWTHLLRG